MLKPIKTVTLCLTALASLCLVILMLLTFVNVVGRLFDRPLTYAVELTELVMGLLILFGLATTTLRRGHISVDIVGSMVSKGTASLLQRFAAAVGFVFITLVAWRLWEKGLGFWSDGLATQVLFIPVFPFVLAMGVAALWAAFIILMQVFMPSIEDKN